MVNNLEHQKLVDEILCEIGSLPYVRLWPRVVGFDEARQIKYGRQGECDLDGILMGGRRIGIEVKTGKGTLSNEQILWRNMIVKFGGLYVVARSVDDVKKAIEKARTM